MTRIAYVSADLGVPIFGQKGCSIHAQEVLGAMLRHGAEVDLFSTSTDGSPPAGLERLRLHPLSRPPKVDSAAREQAALAGNQQLRTELEAAGPFDFVYERYSLWSYGAMEFGREVGIPSLLEVNAPLMEEQARYRVLVDRPAAEHVAERVFSAATALLAVSEEVASWLQRFPVTAGKVRVVPNGIRPERFPEGIVPSASVPGVFTVGFVGTLKAWHGLAVLVEAFSAFHARHPSSRLLIVGDGPERERVEGDIVNRGLRDFALFTGAVPPAEVPGLLASMDVAVAPYPALTDFYFSPLKVYEYMAAGRPVIASQIGQLKKLIQPGINGVLVTPGDASELGEALEKLFRDPVARRHLGHEARRAVLRDHTWDCVLKTIFELAGMKSAAGPVCVAPG